MKRRKISPDSPPSDFAWKRGRMKRALEFFAREFPDFDFFERFRAIPPFSVQRMDPAEESAKFLYLARHDFGLSAAFYLWAACIRNEKVNEPSADGITLQANDFRRSFSDMKKVIAGEKKRKTPDLGV